MVDDNIRKLESTSIVTPQNYHPRSTNYRTPWSSAFKGIFYGCAGYSGSFFYNVTPRAYYTALLNPLSCAYGTVTEDISGYKEYGATCSKFVSLLLGADLPYSTLDFITGNVDFGVTHDMVLKRDIGKLKKYDVLCRVNQQSGHTMLFDELYSSDYFNFIKVKECITPYSQDSVLPIVDDLMYDDHEECGLWYNRLIRKYIEVDYSKVKSLDGRSVWDMPYNEAKPIMCNRGFGSLYVRNYNKVLVSIEDGVESFVLSVNGQLSVEITVSNLDRVTGYRTDYVGNYKLYDITSLCNAYGSGLYSITYKGDVEEFYFKDVSENRVRLVRGTTESKVEVVSGVDPDYYIAIYSFPNDETNYLTNVSGVFPSVVNTLAGDGTITDIKGMYIDRDSQCTYWNDGVTSGV